MARRAGYGACSWRAQSSSDAGEDRALASDAQESHPAGELLPAWRSRSLHRQVRRILQPPALSREPEEPHARRRLLRTGANHLVKTRKDQTGHNPEPVSYTHLTLTTHREV